MYIPLRNNREIVPVVEIENFFNDIEIKNLILLTEKIEFTNGSIGDIENIKFSDTRKSKIKWVVNNEETDWIYKKIISTIVKVNHENYHFTLKYLTPLQFTSYSGEENEYYKIHTDCGNPLDILHYIDIRKLSFSIQLSDEKDYSGGDFSILIPCGEKSNEHITKKKKGTIIIFPSILAHEVKPVISGERLSLVGWVSGPNLL